MSISANSDAKILISPYYIYILMKCEHEDCEHDEMVWLPINDKSAGIVKHLIFKTTISRKENSP